MVYRIYFQKRGSENFFFKFIFIINQYLLYPFFWATALPSLHSFPIVLASSTTDRGHTLLGWEFFLAGSTQESPCNVCWSSRRIDDPISLPSPSQFLSFTESWDSLYILYTVHCLRRCVCISTRYLECNSCNLIHRFYTFNRMLLALSVYLLNFGIVKFKKTTFQTFQTFLYKPSDL